MDATEIIVLTTFASVIVTLVAMWVIRRLSDHKARLFKADDLVRSNERAERELRQKRDHQLNHGRQIFNWLKGQLSSYEKYDEHRGIRVTKLEDNGGKFTIHIDKVWDGEHHGHLLQLTYDFVGLPEPWLGHIHYGKYGADILIWVSSHSPKCGLDQLVIEVVERMVRQDLSVV